ncbi:hypothetical protein [Gordonia aichiensis]|uniref:hypothetical protein n=1 Tax=Gordonia aichiensis TaxID=36820 RepID=UPI003263FE37
MTTADPRTASKTHRPKHFQQWMGRILIGATLSFAVLALTPIASALATTDAAAVPDRPATAAEQTIAALAGDPPADALAFLPADFARRLGYTPVVVDGRPLNPSGDCSSPVPMPEAFTDPCRAHDLGYDLLRYAEATGRPASAWARAALDRRLVADLHDRCTDPACHALAETARAGLALNTWRQRSGPPVRESGAQIAVSYLTRTLETAGLR